MDLDVLSNKLEMKYYQNLIKSSKPSDSNYKLYLAKYQELSKIDDNNTETESIKLKEEENNSSESQGLVYSDDYLYKKPWTKLSPVHKIIKLKEFISNLLINSQEEEERLKREITKLVNSKILTKKDKVNYDNVKGRVISIPILIYKNNKYIIKN